MREALYKIFAPRSTSGNLERCLCVTETEGEEPLAFRINLEKRHLVGTEKPVIAPCRNPPDACGQRIANVSEAWVADGDRLFEHPCLFGRQGERATDRTMVEVAGSRLMRQPFACVTFGYAGFLRQSFDVMAAFERLIEPSRSPIRAIGTLNAPPRPPSILPIN